MASKIYSTKDQMTKLAHIMKDDPDLARGYLSKPQAREKWKKISKTLNELGPPERTVDKWCKVWADVKSKTRIKLRHNHLLRESKNPKGRKLQKLNPLEEIIASVFENDFNASTSEEKRPKRRSKPKVKKEETSEDSSDSSIEDSPLASVKEELIEDPLSSIDEYALFNPEEVITPEAPSLAKEQLQIQEHYYKKMLLIKSQELEIMKEKMDLMKKELIRKNHYRREKLILKKLYIQKQNQLLESIQNTSNSL